jgi:hypothetical protein
MMITSFGNNKANFLSDGPLAVIVLALWIFSIVVIARTKTEDPLDRIVWLLIVLVLNIFGSALYLIFGPKASRAAEKSVNYEYDREIKIPDYDYDREMKRRANEGTL